jgi:hypothetical protein
MYFAVTHIRLQGVWNLRFNESIGYASVLLECAEDFRIIVLHLSIHT